MFSEPHACLRIDFHRDLLLIELSFEFDQKFIHDVSNRFRIERIEMHDAVEAIAKLGTEEAFDFLIGITRMVLQGKPDRCARNSIRTGVRRHDDDDVTKICFAPVGIGQGSMIHDL